MMIRMAAVVACLWCWSVAAPATGQGSGREVHGVGETYGGLGVSIAWAVLRGASESSTLVVLRVAADPAAYASADVVGRNPFTQGQRQILSRMPVGQRVEVRIARADFADFPRTELRFWSSSPAMAAPALVVYYLGVPDTTPEFANEAALDAYLTARIERIRARKSP
jgi:hypothetical protein